MKLLSWFCFIWMLITTLGVLVMNIIEDPWFLWWGIPLFYLPMIMVLRNAYEGMKNVEENM